MKSKFLKVAAAAMAVVCLAGCSAGNFTSKSMIGTAKKYGMKETDDIYNVTNVWSGGENGAVYYTATELNDINSLMWMFVSPYTKAEIDEIIICTESIPTSKEPGAGNCISYICQVTAQDEKNAVDIAETISNDVMDYEKVSSGEKDGYSYFIIYENFGQTDDGKPSYEFVRGVYQKGNVVIVIYGTSRADNKKSCAAYFCKQLGLESPFTLRK